VKFDFFEFYRKRLTPSHYYGELSSRATALKVLMNYSSILGVGSARAILEDHLASLGKRVVASDIDPRFKDLVLPLYQALKEYITCDVRAIPFPDNSFECVYSQGLFEHYPIKEVHKGVKEMLRVASKAVVIDIPLKDCKEPELGEKEFRRTQKEWLKIFAKWGFKVKAIPYREGQECVFVILKA